jgi:hypothetical protein
MKRIGTTLSMLVLAGSLAGSAIAQEDVSVKDKGPNTVVSNDEGLAGYCNQHFPAIRQSTLGSDKPELKNSQTGDVIDYYGPCDESATGADQVWNQELDREHRRSAEYMD